jgi:hypothetical protein
MLSNSLRASVIASEKNQCAEVIIARRGDLTAIVKRTFPNHQTTKYSFGYARFGMPTVWLHKNVELPFMHSYDELDCVRARAEQSFKAADEVTALRAAK